MICTCKDQSLETCLILCTKCGCERWSSKEIQQAGIRIWFAGKLWEFKNWDEAKEKGFYLG